MAKVEFRERHLWPELNGLLVIDSRREIGATIESETQLYITALTLPAEHVVTFIRNHWTVKKNCVKLIT